MRPARWWSPRSTTSTSDDDSAGIGDRHPETPHPRLDALVQALEHGDPRVALLFGGHQVPGRQLVVGAGEHLLGGAVVVAVAGPVAPILLRQLPALERVVLAAAEPGQLLLVADVQPELHQDASLDHQGTFESDDHLVGAPPLLLGGESLDPLDEHAAVPAAVEDAHPAETGHGAVEAPQEVVALLVVARRAVRRHRVVPWVEVLHDALDRSALATGVAALEHHHESRAEGSVAELTP